MSFQTTTIFAKLNLATASAAKQSIATAAEHVSLAGADTNTADTPEHFYFTCDLVHEGRNGNGDVFLRDEMAAAWHTLVGQPVDKDHILGVDGAVGQITDAAFDIVDGLAEIRIAAYISKQFYPDVAWKLAAGIITGVSMECAFEFGDQRSTGRILHGVRFVGAGLTRVPADVQSQIDHMGTEALSVSSRRRQLLLFAVTESLLRQRLAV